MSSSERAAHLARYGWNAMKAGEMERGTMALKEAVQLAPNVAEYWYAYATALCRSMRLVEACEVLRRCAAFDDRNIAVWCMLGEASMQRGDFAGAAVALKKCLDLDPKARDPHGLRARALIKRGERHLGKK